MEREGVKGSLNAISQLDKEMRELSEYCPNEDPIEQMKAVVQMFESWRRLARMSNAKQSPVSDCQTTASTEVFQRKASLAGSKPSKQYSGPAERWKPTQLAAA